MTDIKTICKRILALAVLAVTVFVLLFSVYFLASHAAHSHAAHAAGERQGTECPICAVMEQCNENLETITTVILAVCAGLILYISAQKAAPVELPAFCNHSLFSQKVRWNN